MKYLTNILTLFTILFYTNIDSNADDLIGVVLDDNLTFTQNNLGRAPSGIYTNFDFSKNFAQTSLFEIAADFPVNIDGFFTGESEHIKLKLNQINFNWLKQTQPNDLEINIPVAQNKSFKLLLSKSDPITAGFQFKNIGGSNIAFSPGVFYHGVIKDNSTSWASVSIFDNYMRILLMDYEGIYVLSSITGFNEYYILYNDKNLGTDFQYYANPANTLCGAVEDETELPQAQPLPQQLKLLEVDHKVKSAKKQNTDSSVKISIECDYTLLEHKGSLQEIYNYVSATFNETAIIYANEFMNIQLSELVAWDTPDDYNKNFAGTVLQQFANNRRNEFNGDLLHLFTAEYRDMGGIAYVDVLGQSYKFDNRTNNPGGPYGISVVDYLLCAFGLYHYDVWTFAHELGHNFGSLHSFDTNWIVNGMNGKGLDNSHVCGQAQISCFDHEAFPGELETTGGTFMSYFVQRDEGASFYRGFGSQPGEVIYQNYFRSINSGCTDPNACNFNPQAIFFDASCVYGNNTNDHTIFDDYPWLTSQLDVKNCTNQSIMVYQFFYQYQGQTYTTNNISLTDGTTTNIYTCYGARTTYLPDNFELLKSWTCINCNGNIKGCTDPNACNYKATASISDNSCNYPNQDCASNGCDTNCNCTVNEQVANTNQDIFVMYPWLKDSINYRGTCIYDKITVYQENNNEYILIEFFDATAKLYKNQEIFCDTNYCSDCNANTLNQLTNSPIGCWTCEASCEQTGTVYYQICDKGQSYYLIETSNGEVIDPYNAPGVNFDYPNGAVVKFSYSEVFPSACEYANKGVTINCIEAVTLPCTNTGTVFSTTCNEQTYNLIQMTDGTILDPYNSPIINFQYSPGEQVKFAFMPFTNIYCDASDVAGRVTCIESINNCFITGIVFYEICDGVSNYLIRTTDGDIIDPYNEPGVNFDYPNGAVVEFSYSSTRQAGCNTAQYGVNISCIETVELPCTHTGTIISNTCEGEIYYLIDKGSEGIIDPYNGPLTNFDFELNLGAYVEFAYMPIYYSPCDLVKESGILTCIKTACSNEIRKINVIPISSGIYNDSKYIEAYGEVHQFSNVVLKAPDRISLKSGFKVEAGATFKAVNENCQ